MDNTKFDTVTRDLADGTTRRRVIAGLGVLTLSGVVALGRARVVAANAHERCVDRCVTNRGDGADVKKKRERCRRQCAGR